MNARPRLLLNAILYYRVFIRLEAQKGGPTFSSAEREAAVCGASRSVNKERRLRLNDMGKTGPLHVAVRTGEKEETVTKSTASECKASRNLAQNSVIALGMR